MKSIELGLFISLLVGGCIQQAALTAAVETADRHLEIGAPFQPFDLKSFTPLPGCERDRVGVVSCSAVGPLGELYVIFEGKVVRVDVEVSDAAFSLGEFAGLGARSTANDVKRWAKTRGAEVVDGYPADAPELYTVLALEFPSRWCRRGCYAAFFFANEQLTSIRILTNEPPL